MGQEQTAGAGTRYEKNKKKVADSVGGSRGKHPLKPQLTVTALAL